MWTLLLTFQNECSFKDQVLHPLWIWFLSACPSFVVTTKQWGHTFEDCHKMGNNKPPPKQPQACPTKKFGVKEKHSLMAQKIGQHTYLVHEVGTMAGGLGLTGLFPSRMIVG